MLPVFFWPRSSPHATIELTKIPQQIRAARLMDTIAGVTREV